MITIIHGDDVAASRRYYTRIKSATDNPVTLPVSSLSITNLAQVLEGGGLFTNPENIFIEDFLTQKKQQTDFQIINEYILSHSKDHLR